MSILRKPLAEREIGHEPYFRWRGGDVSRLEGLSDAVFGFAIATLAMSFETGAVGRDAFLIGIAGFLSFAGCLAILLMFWTAHYTFFRRYGLEDRYTLVVNSFLLGFVVFYMYPLKHLFDSIITKMFGFDRRVLFEGMTLDDAKLVMLVYGAGFFAVSALLALLYRHAWARRQDLDLTPAEVLLTRASIRHYAIYGLVAVQSIVLSYVVNPFIGGMSYMTIGIYCGLNGVLTGRKVTRVAEVGEPDVLD